MMNDIYMNRLYSYLSFIFELHSVYSPDTIIDMVNLPKISDFLRQYDKLHIYM